jgi:hypothetical protein
MGASIRHGLDWKGHSRTRDGGAGGEIRDWAIRFRHHIKSVGTCGGRSKECLVFQVSNGFSGSNKQRRGLHPAHRENQSEPGELWLACFCRNHHIEFLNIISIYPHTIKAFCNVYLGQEHWAQSGFCLVDHGEDAPQSATELHGLDRCLWDGFQVDNKERISAYCSESPVTPRNHSEGTESQVGLMDD